MNMMKTKKMAGWVLIVGMSTLLAACGKQDKVEISEVPVDPAMVTVSAEFLPRLAIAAAAEGAITESLHVPARIEVDEQRVARIGAAVTGRVLQINAVLGQRVKDGEVLATLHSSELSTVQLSYLKALTQADLQQKAVERAKLLYAADVIGAAELQRRESEYAQAQSESKAMQRGNHIGM